MKLALRPLLIAVLALWASPISPAQMGMGMRPPDFAGVFSPVVGSGAAYEMDKKDDRKTKFDIAVVGREGAGYWIEYSMQSPGGMAYMKTLTAREGDDVIVQHMIVQIPGHPPMDMSSMMKMHAMQSAQSKADMRANAQDLGTETITTPAGTFACQHWRSKKDGSEFWLSDKVTPWKVVKMSGKDQTMTLVRVITDAKTHITGTPVSMEDMMRQRLGKPE